MKTVAVYHHMGLGDHIICNGAIRTLAKEHNVVVFSKEHNYKKVARMFSDEVKITVFSCPQGKNLQEEQGYVFKFMEENPNAELLMLGFTTMPNRNFDEVFYACANVPFENRWSESKFPRNLALEKEILDRLNPSGEPFIFVHDDPSRGYTITPTNRNNMKIIKNDMSVDVFDMCGVLEAAQEIHCMESSFKCLIESIPSIICPLYLHKNLRVENGSLAISTAKKKWIEI